jgi:calcineurin-like phosphoesterase family protein
MQKQRKSRLRSGVSSLPSETRLCTFMHISDLHIGDPDPNTGDSRVKGPPPWWDRFHWLDGFLGHHRIALEQLAHAFYQLRDGENARLIVSGDLTSAGAPSQFQHVRNYLTGWWKVGGLDPIGLDVRDALDFAVPGNHDHWPGDDSIVGGPTDALRQTFPELPFVRGPIALDGGRSLILAGIDSDADVNPNGSERVLARGDFLSQLASLSGALGEPDEQQIRVLLMHHSRMYHGPDGLILRVSRDSQDSLNAFIKAHDIAVILAGHVHLPDSAVSPFDAGQASWDVLEARCGTTSVRSQAPPGWPQDNRLAQNTFLVHRLVATAGLIQWWTNYYLRTELGFVDQGLLVAPLAVWPRPHRGAGTTAADFRRWLLRRPRVESAQQENPLLQLGRILAASLTAPKPLSAIERHLGNLAAYAQGASRANLPIERRLRDAAMIAAEMGRSPELSAVEEEKMNRLRAAAEADRQSVIDAVSSKLLPALPRELRRLDTFSENVTPLQIFRAIAAVEMMVVRSLRRHESGSASLFRSGAVTVSGKRLPRGTVVGEVMLAAQVSRTAAQRLLQWIWSASAHHPALFAGLRLARRGTDEIALTADQRGAPTDLNVRWRRPRAA